MENKDDSKLFPIISIRELTEKYVDGNTPTDELHDDTAVKAILSKLIDAFTTWGFVYLVDHGVEAAETFKMSRQFFEREKSFKEQYVRVSNESNWGYVPFKFETFEKSRPFDLKECFNFTPQHNLPDEKIGEISEFVKVATKFTHECFSLTKILLHVLSPAVLKDSKDFLLSTHQGVGNVDLNVTTLRMLHYPYIDNEQNILENQLRCGEHSDYGTITLLFQDDVGGLQVVSPTGEYVDVVPVPGSVVVNIGDLMERWTSGRFKSTKHRVLISSDHNTVRQSLAYFVHPDSNVDVSCLDGSDKFQSVNALTYLLDKFAGTYD